MKYSITTNVNVAPILFSKSLSEAEAEVVGNVFKKHGKEIVDTIVTDESSLVLATAASCGHLDNLLFDLKENCGLSAKLANESEAKAVLNAEIVIDFCSIDNKFKSVY